MIPAFAEAARIRDCDPAVRRVTKTACPSMRATILDVIGVAFDAVWPVCIKRFIRRSKVLGSAAAISKAPRGTELGEVVETLSGKFYLQGSQMRIAGRDTARF